MNKGIFYNMSSWSQLFFLILFAFCGMIFGTLISLLIASATGNTQSLDFMRIMQVFQAACIFLIPAWLCAWLFHPQPYSFLRLKKSINLKFLFLSLLLIIAIQPFISFTGHYNNMMTLPESLAPLEAKLRQMEEMARLLTEQLLTTDSVGVLLLNIFVVAIVAGITEEFFFRGAMQQIFKKIIGNRHFAVWITAFIFSFIHFQFYGFVPRFILGAVLGYIFLWSGNLWIPVIIHSFNNLMSILLFHFYHGTLMYEQAESLGTGNTFWLTPVSVVITGVILYLLSREYVENNPEDFPI